jgi:hypothetical protein
VFAAAISRYAPLLDAIRRGRIAEAQLIANVRLEARTGRRVPPELRTSPFPDAYFHLPEELQEEPHPLRSGGRRHLWRRGTGGLASRTRLGRCQRQGTSPRISTRYRERLPPAVESAHLLGVARKPTRPERDG